jgi:hypothetical protein
MGFDHEIRIVSTHESIHRFHYCRFVWSSMISSTPCLLGSVGE